MTYIFTDVEKKVVTAEIRRRLKRSERSEILRVSSKTVDLARIDHIFSDADGTIVRDGAVAFDQDKVELLRRLHEAGVGVTVVTGKPYAEVAKLRGSLPEDIPLSFICEKGAYLAIFDEGAIEREFILSTPELEQQVAELKERFFAEFAPYVTEKYGVHFALSGSGTHRSLLGIDQFASPPPDDYLDRIGDAREVLKVTDKQKIAAVEAEIAAFVASIHPEWRVVHMGGANTEIAPGPIEKDKGIERTSEYHEARQVMVLGDSWNDHAMLKLSSAHPDKASAGLVVFRETAIPLANDADFVTIGMANTNPILEAILDARHN